MRCNILVISCSDERIHSWIPGFVKDKFGEDKFVAFYVPGAAINIAQEKVNNRPEFGSDYQDGILARIKDLIIARRVKKIVIINHQDCGDYQYSNEKEVRTHHFKDLRQAKNILLDTYRLKYIRICLYYATFIDRTNYSKGLNFEPVF